MDIGITAHVRTEELVQIRDLPAGNVFMTRDMILAVKSEYHYSTGECQCILLSSGEYAHFEQGDDTLVAPVSIALSLATYD